MGGKNHKDLPDFSLVYFLEFEFNFKVFYCTVVLMMYTDYKNRKHILRTYMKSIFCGNKSGGNSI